MSFLFIALLAVVLDFFIPGVSGRQISTGSAQIDPAKTDEIVDLFLMAAVATTVPIEGRIEYIFPLESRLPYETEKNCQLSVPPNNLQVICSYTQRSDGRIKLTANFLSDPIFSGQFFELRVPGFKSPRSTAETDSFEFSSFDGEDNLLDFQSRGIVVRATEFKEIKSVTFESTDPTVGKADSFLLVTFSTLQDLQDSDQIQVKLPKWNPESFAPRPMITYDQAALDCSGISNSKKQITCFIQRGSKYDIIKLNRPLQKSEGTETVGFGGASSSEENVPGIIEAGSEISFLVGPITNPISTAPVFGFEILTLTDRSGKIAIGYGQLQVFQPATVGEDPDTVSLTVTETLINKQSNFLIEVDVPLPLNRGCKIDIVLPSPLKLGAEMNEVIIGGLFGSIRSADMTLDPDRNLIEIYNACRMYRQNTVKASFDLQSLVNPGYVMTSDSFEIIIYDIDMNPIVKASQNIDYSTTPGELLVFPWIPANREVSAMTEVIFSIQPVNPTPNADVGFTIQLPKEDIEGIADPCKVTYYNQLINPDTINCVTDQVSNTIIINQVLQDAYTYEPLSVIEFGIESIKMPSSERPTGDYTVDFFAKVLDSYRLIDTVTVTNILERALPGGLLQVNAAPIYGTTYTEDTMVISFIAGHKILQGGYITIDLPPELRFVESAACITFSVGFSLDADCSIDVAAGKLTVVNGFTDAAYDTLEKPVEIQVAGIFTPRSQMPTTNFKIQTFDKDWYRIDTHATYFLPPLKVDKAIEVVRVIQVGNIVGESTTYDVLFQSPYPIYTGDLLTLTVPEQAKKDLASTFEHCQGSSEQAYLKKSLNTVLMGINSLMIRVELEDGLFEIPIGAEFGVQIAMLHNPESTRPSDPFHVQITDRNEKLVVAITEDQSLLTEFVMHATEPSNLIYGHINNSPKQALEPTIIKMTLFTQHMLPAVSQLQIQVPAQLGLPEDDKLADEIRCWIDSSPFGEVRCDFDKEASLLTLTDINPHGSLRGGTELNIELKGFYNRKIAEPTDSFQAMTLTIDGYKIDRSTWEMPVASNCDWPCWDCPAGEPTRCLKCDTRPSALLPLYFNGSCVDTCPSNYFNMNKICSQCDEGCLECDLTSQQCHECHFGRYLLGNTCLDVCPTTHWGIMDTKTCELCEPPCKTCIDGLDHCTTCDQSLPESFFFQNKCYESCPRDISVEDEGVCIACNPVCKTCDSDFSFDYCTSCYTDKFLDHFSNSCVSECPAGVTVARTDAVNEKGQTLTCDVCHETCRLCDPFDTTICLECAADLKLLETEKKCIEQCPVGTAEVWIPLTDDTVCAECAPGCVECEYSREHCTICQDDFFFHDYTCVKQCPDGFKQLNDATRTCVLEREICPYGQRYNKLGQCELYLSECKVGYVLNASKTECIPEPGFHLPFAFLYAAAGWAFYILRRKNRSAFSREVLISQLLLGFTALMQLSYIVQLILSYQMGFDFLIGMHQLALFVHYFFNLLTMVAIHMRIRDKPYQHWRDQYTRESRIIATVSTLYSFKATRMLFSNFLGKPYFDVVCENRFRTMIRPFFLLTMGCILQPAAILIANVYTIWLLRWGYEIVTLAISSIIMTLLICGLEIAEFVLYRDQEPAFLAVKDYFSNQLDPAVRRLRDAHQKKQQKYHRRSQVRVMSGLVDADNCADMPQDSDSNFSSQGEVNQTHKVLLDKKNINSECKPTQAESSAFKFENFRMGSIVKVNPERIDIGEQGHAPALQQMIKRLDEHDRIKKLRQELDAIDERQRAAYDGTDLPQTDDDADSQNPQPAVIDRYLDEDVRKQLLVSTSKHKQRQFRERRQHFEKHRQSDEEVFKLPFADSDDPLGRSRSQILALNGQSGAATGQGNTQTVALAFANEITPEKGDQAAPNAAEDFMTEQKSKLKEVTIPRQSTQKKPLQSLITTVKVAKYDDDIDFGTGRRRKPDYLSILQECSEDELERDKLLYDQFYVKFKKEFDDKAKKGELVPNSKLHQSFDEDVLREMYDDFGVCSDFESELSWISYPPNKGCLRDYYENNPVKQAENELFKQKIKIKFQYCNLYRESYSLPPKPEPNVKPSVKTQTNAADLLPEQVQVEGREMVTVNLDFDPFESEEEFILEESEWLSAIDEDVCKDLINKVVFEGFSDVDSDDIRAQQKLGEGVMLDDDADDVLSLSKSQSASKVSRSKGSRPSKNRKNGVTTKKRKRDDMQQDFVQRQAQAKQEAQALRVGLNGRATVDVEQLNLEGKLGDVFDTDGHLVYDKDYISRLEEEEGPDSIKAGSVHSGKSRDSKTPSPEKRSSSQLQDSAKQVSHATKQDGADVPNRPSFYSGGRSSQEQAAIAQNRKDTPDNLSGKEIGEKSVDPHFADNQTGTFDAQQQISQQNLTQVARQASQSLSPLTGFNTQTAAQLSGQRPMMETELRQGGPFYNFDNDFSEDDLRTNTHLSRRDRQLIRAYGQGVPEALLPPEQSRKKPKTSANRKRKRIKALKMPMRMDMTGSDRGLADAQEQLQQDMNSPDNGILQLVISRDAQRDTQRPQQVDNPPSAMVVTQLKAADKASGGDRSDLDNTNLGDAETRGGNLSSHNGSKHYGGTTQYSAAGFNQSSIVGGHMTGSGTDGAGVALIGPSSAAKAHQYLGAPTCWESDTSNSMMVGHFGGLHALKQNGLNSTSSPGRDAGATRTDDENRRRRNMNQTEVQGNERGDDEVVNDFRDADESVPMGGNWSDNGGAQQFNNGRVGTEIEAGGDPFSRLGQSYHYPFDRKLQGPQPFQSLGVSSKPYKAKHKRRNEQLLADQRRAKMSMGGDRLHKLENIYFKYGPGASGKLQQHKQLPPKHSRIPNAESASNEIYNVFRRHQARAVADGPGFYSKMPSSASASKPGGRRRMPGPRLHKQNFIEDGHNIISGQLLSKNQASEVLKVNRELWPNQQLSNSGSESPEAQMMHHQNEQTNQFMKSQQQVSMRYAAAGAADSEADASRPQ